MNHQVQRFHTLFDFKCSQDKVKLVLKRLRAFLTSIVDESHDVSDKLFKQSFDIGATVKTIDDYKVLVLHPYLLVHVDIEEVTFASHPIAQ